MAYIGAGISRFNTADELTVTGTSEFGGNVSFGDNNITNVGSLQIDSIAGDADTNTNITFAGSDVITMTTAGSERLRLDASGNLLVGTTDPLVGSGTGNNTEGLALSAGSYGGYATFSRSGSECLNLNRKTNDGTILNFRKDGSTVGLISVYGADMFIGTDDAGLTFNNSADLIAPVNPTTGATRDGAIDLGASNARFKDGYFSGILYNTSLRGQNDTDTGIDVGDTTGSLSNTLTFLTAGSERMRIDTSGNLLVGKSSTAGNVVGTEIRSNGRIQLSADGDDALRLNRKNSDGPIQLFQKDGTTVGKISAYAGSIIAGSGDTGIFFYDGGDVLRPVSPTTLSTRDNTIDIGSSSARFKDLYLSGGAYIGGTGSANKLDDYEEGAITGMTVNSGTITTGNGRYTKIGNRVFFSVLIGAFSDETSSTTIAITGLPFTSSANNKSAATIMARYYYGSSVQVVGYIQQNSNQIYLYAMNGTGDWDTIQHSELTSGSANFFITGHYEAA